MRKVDIKGLLIEEDFLFNYKQYNLTAEEAIFLMQLNYISNDEKIFTPQIYASKLSISEDILLQKMQYLNNKNIISLNSNNELIFNIFVDKNNYYSLRELLVFVEKWVNKILTQKDLDIVASWIDKKYTKKEINEAFSISRNINYVNGILNNKPLEKNNELNEDDILGYDWFNK